jgi:hypothetical protein
MLLRRIVQASLAAAALTAMAAEDVAFFEAKVLPILQQRCFECHSHGQKIKGGLTLDSRSGWERGGESGPAIVPGKAESSLVFKAVSHREKDLQMPPKKMLPQSEIDVLVEWIRKGAPDPRVMPSQSVADLVVDDAWEVEFQKRLDWWSLKPMHRPAPPTVEDAAWSREPIDRFIRARLDTANLTPAPPADPETLVRRLSFVLTGLPAIAHGIPPAHESYEQLVDRLLASPHFGERFARRWMDVVRYTDTYGYEWDNPAKGAHEYRDYLIRAFNDDIGFDRFLREQLAGDLLPQPRIHTVARTNESLIAPMFYHLGEHRHGSSLMFNGIHQDMVNNKIDAFSKAFLATTVACARCHDHKLEAVSQHDYYALAAVFTTPRWTARIADAPDLNDAAMARLKELRAAIRTESAQEWRKSLDALSPRAIRQWALANRQTLESAKPGDVAHPLSQLIGDTAWLKPENLTASATAEMKLVPGADGSISTSGAAPERDTYTVRFTTPPGSVSLLRLEALTDDKLPRRGPGMTNLGNFVLTDLRVEVRPRTAPGAQGEAAAAPARQVKLASASADYSQPNYSVESLLTPPARRKGWAVGLGPNADRTARFAFAESVALPHGGEWTITLVQNYGDQHLLGRFRITPGGFSGSSSSSAGMQPADETVSALWTRLTNDWRSTRTARQKTNASFQWLADFRDATLPKGWVIEGDGMKHGYTEDATPLIALSGDQILSGLLPRGYHTHALSSKLPGSLRMPPQHTVPGKIVSLKLEGGEFGGYLVMDDHTFQNETITFLSDAQAPWKSFNDAELKNGVQQVTIDFTTSALNPNFPPRTGLSKGLKYQDFGHDKRSWLSITGIVSHDTAGTPQGELTTFTSLYDTSAPVSLDEAWARVSAWLTNAVQRWCDGSTQSGDREVLDWLLAQNILLNKIKPKTHLASLVRDYRSVESAIPFPRTVNSMDERDVVKVSYPLNVRGNVDTPGELVPPDFLRMFSGKNQVASSQHSGRLELADSLLDPEHPLIARVYVNRVWQWLFGTGLVATPDDFGRLGDRPSHPELLDWLAREFIREGWSTKKLVRRVVLSEAFRQSSIVTTAGRERDPSNRLLHHYATRRLEAEEIRDSLLVVSGRLDARLYGRPILPFRPVEDGKKRLFTGPIDGEGRRSLYLQMSIMDPPKFLVGFNLPDLKLPTGRRDVTNVPSQALIMLNDPFVLAMAKHWSTEITKDKSRTTQSRIEQMFLRAYGRTPRDAELPRWLSALEEFGGNIPDAWERLAHAFFNTKEFIYYR